MRIIVILGMGIFLTSCTRDRDRPAAREVGRDAYRASEELKRGAKEAAHELHNAGKEIRQGWNEAKHDKRDDLPRKH